MLAVPQENRTMKIRLMIAAILALSLLVGSTMVGAAGGITIVSRTGDGIWDGDTWKVEIYPGETESTTIKLYNSSYNKLNVKVRIKPKSLDDGNLIFELDKKNLTLVKKSYMEVTLTVKVSEDTKPGTYSVGLKLKVAGRGIENEVKTKD